MKTHNFSNVLKTFTFTLFMSAILSCNSNADNKKESGSDSSMNATTSQSKESIPDSTVQFLITSAADDFSNYKQSTPIDFRKVKVGYMLTSTNEKTFVLCGEFLSKEKKDEWLPFATLKTSGYEQYLGNQALSFCDKTTMVLTDESKLSFELKNRVVELRK